MELGRHRTVRNRPHGGKASNNEEKTKMEMQNAVSDIKNDILKKMYEKKDKSIPDTNSKSGLINKNVRYNRQKKMQLKII